MSTNTKTALLLLARGFEELECSTAVNVLRRGEVKVTVAGVSGREVVQGRCDIKIQPDVSINDVLSIQYDAVILPGGLEGTKRLSESKVVGHILKEHEKSGKLIGAICAAPTALKTHGIGCGKTLTVYPSLASEFEGTSYVYDGQCAVVIDGNLITSQGPATALPFAFTILEKLTDKDRAAQVAKAMLYDSYK